MLIPEKALFVLWMWSMLALVGTWIWIYLDRKERKEIENGKD